MPEGDVRRIGCSPPLHGTIECENGRPRRGYVRSRAEFNALHDDESACSSKGRRGGHGGFDDDGPGGVDAAGGVENGTGNGADDIERHLRPRLENTDTVIGCINDKRRCIHVQRSFEGHGPTGRERSCDAQVITEFEAIREIEPGEGFTGRIRAEDEADVVRIEVLVEGDAGGDADGAGSREEPRCVEVITGGGADDFEGGAREGRGEGDDGVGVGDALASGEGDAVTRPRELAGAVRLEDLAGGTAVTGRKGVGDAVEAEGGLEGGGAVDDEGATGVGSAGDADVIGEFVAVFGVEEGEGFVRRVTAEGENSIDSTLISIDCRIALKSSCTTDNNRTRCSKITSSIKIV